MNDGFIVVPALFFLLGLFFLGMQMRREHAWLQSMGGFEMLYDDDDI